MDHVTLDAFDMEEARTMSGPGLASFYNLIYADRGWKLPKHLMPVCNALADTRIDKLMLILGPGSGKSQLISVAYPTWLLGLDPTMTIIGVSGAEGLINGFMSASMEIIEQSAAYRSIFPSTKPDKDAGWSLERGMFVTGRKPGDPDASFWGAGLTSKTLAGKHARTMILDDLHTDINSQTVDQCMKVRDVYYNTLCGRANPFGCRFVLAGRRWHEEDLYGHLLQNEDWVTMVLPAIRDNETRLYYDIYIPDGVTCCFNEGDPSC
ncbi:MAG: hypothetical protein ACYCS8_15930 [Acidithiobacillus sp.]